MFDALVIGAGAAGLAAARDLSGAGKRVCIIEARQRIGGRIHTLHLPDLPLPVELGAEFVHGEVDDTFKLVEAAAIAACRLPDDHWWVDEGRRERIGDFWGEVNKVLARIGRLRSDRSFDEFLRRGRFRGRQRELALGFVEGYHAAHADRMSALALRSADGEQDDPSGNNQFRLLNGQDALVDWLRAGLDPDRVKTRLGTVAIAIRHRRDSVTVDVRGAAEQSLKAKSAIVTIPIGVWRAARDQEGTLRFDPPLEEKERAVANIEVGHVVKIAFRFAERFWDEQPFNFLHSNDPHVPTWWTTAPVRSPLLTAWAGGHAAERLLAEGEAAMTDRALDSMATAFSVRRPRLERLLVGTYTHNWQADPFSRGAYSYAGVGGSAAHKVLARRSGRLFFAGEATNGEQTGTVAGAIESGRRAAKEVLRIMA